MATSSNLEYPISDTAVRTTIQNGGGVSSTDTSFDVGEVTNAPTTPFLIAVWVKQSPLKEDDMEIMEVTSISGTTLTVNRGQKSTAVRSFSDGDYVYMAVGSADLFDAVGAPTKIEDPLGDVIDPATSSDVQAVESAIGDEEAASQEADSTLSATAIERLTALVDALESGRATDEIRVSSVRGATPVPTPIVERQIVSTAGSPESVRSSSTSLGSGAEVRGLPTNSGNAYVWISGGSKSQSRILTPGDEVFIPTDDLSNIKVDVDTGGEGVSIVAA